jgi:tRNA(Ser,Leu) C12 N-acetylase TAN1
MNDWNVVISIYKDGFREVRRGLQEFGPVERTNYHNVLVMRAADPIDLLEAVERKTEETPAFYDAISRVAPGMRAFDFQSAQELEENVKSIMAEWSQRLARCSFHVRLHRRGMKRDRPTPEAERLFDDAILDSTQRADAPAKLAFTDPDAVIAIDTVDDRAGIGLWTRADLLRHRLLRPD